MASANNAFANGTVLAAPPSRSSVDPTGNTRETGEPTTFGTTDGTAWWTYTPASNQTVTFTTEGSGGDTVLGVFVTADVLQPIAVNNLSAVASNHGGAADGQSKVTVALTSGTPYYIQVGSFTSSLPGNYTLLTFTTDTGYERVAHDFAAAVIDTKAGIRVAHDFAGTVVDRHAPIRSAHDFGAAMVDRRAPVRVAHAFAAVILGSTRIRVAHSFAAIIVSKRPPSTVPTLGPQTVMLYSSDVESLIRLQLSSLQQP